MKSLKKTLVLLVVLSMIFSTLVPAFAATDVAELDCEDAVLRMEALDIIEGYEDGTFKPENTITRAEMAVIICKMTGITKAAADASANVDSKFSDVKAGEWYTGWINIATGNGIIAGFPDGTYRPNEVLTLNQVLTLCVKALGRGAYVDQMGTWPANYVTEAAKLGLLDDVSANSTDANRGNVAIIAWNTLQARLWDVNETKLDGEVSLGNTANTLLNTHFRAYCFEGELKEIKDVAVTVVPSTDKDLGDRQVTLDILNSEETDFNYAAAKAFDKAPSKDEDEVTYKNVDTDGDLVNVVAYIPEEVYADLDDLLGRKVTVIFGDDNEVALVIVEDDVVNNEYATRYDDKKLTVGGTKYKFADTFGLYVNNTEVDDEATLTDLEGVLDVILEDTYVATKDFEKNIEANVILNTKGKVSRLDLYVSGTFGDYYTYETVVGKVRNSVIYAQNGTKRLYDYDEETVEDEELPTVYVDGEKASIEDIKVGDVVTIYYEDATDGTAKEYDENEAVIIYVSTKTAEGTVTRVKNEKTLTIDGEAYTASAIDVNEVLLLNEEDVKDAETADADAIKKLVDEDVTLYLNIYGEYVLVASDEVNSDYQFAIIEHFYDVEEDEEDADLFTQKLRLFMADGTTSREYKISYDASEFEDGDDGYVEDPLDGIAEALLFEEGDFIAFSADANNEIEVDDIYVVDADFNDGYDVVVVPAETVADFDNERITLDGTTYRAKDSTVIFNGNEGDPEIIKWKALVNESDEKVVADATIVCEEDNTTIAYVYINEADTAESDYAYAAVLETGYTEKINNKVYVMSKILDANGEEVELKDDNGLATEDYIVAYKTSSDKLTVAEKLVDIITVNDLKDTAAIEGLYSGTVAKLLHNLEARETEATHGTVEVAAEAAQHGTVDCQATTTDTCTCTGFVAATVAQHGTVDCTATTTDTCTCTGFVAAEAAQHGTVACTATTTDTCTCTGFVAAKAATHGTNCADQSNCDGSCEGGSKATEAQHGTVACTATTTDTCTCTGFVAATAAQHGTVACTATTTDACTCTGFVAATAAGTEDCDGTCGGTCEGYVAGTITDVTKESFAVEEIDGDFIIYNDDKDIARLADVEVDTEEVVVIDVTGDTPVVVDFDAIEVGDLVVAYSDAADDTATLLVIVK